MARKWVFGMAASLGAISAVGMQAAPALASSNVGPTSKSAIVGVLGYEGGGPTTKFHPTSGTVEVEFTNPPLVLLKKVGNSGHFRIPLGPGQLHRDRLRSQLERRARHCVDNPRTSP